VTNVRWRQTFSSPWVVLSLGIAVIALSLIVTFWIEPTDVIEYARYARAGLLPPLLTHWPIEYPTLSEAVFLLPRLLPFAYQLSFGLLAGLAFLVLLSQGKHPPEWAYRVVIYVALGGLAVLTGRYDIFAVLAATLGIESAARERYAWAWFWLGIGFLLKLYPAVFMPVLFVWQYRRQGRLPWRELATTVLSLLLVLIVEVRWAGPSALSPYQFLGHRPLEIGSLPGAIAAALDFTHTRILFAFGALNIVTPMSSIVGLVFDLIMVLAIGTELFLVYMDVLDLRAGSLLVLVTLLLTSKVFSVQFILWLIPLWSYYPLNRYWIAASLLSTAGYPVAYFYAVRHSGWWALVIVLYGLRSAAIFAGTWVAIKHRRSGLRLPQ